MYIFYLIYKIKLHISLGKINILIIEDEEDNYFLLHEFLIDYGYNLLWAKNGVEGIDYYNKYDIDIILLDMRIPYMSGYEVLSNIRENNITIPIIAQTAYVSVNEKNKLIKLGCTDYLPKPIILTDLINMIKKYTQI